MDAESQGDCSGEFFSMSNSCCVNFVILGHILRRNGHFSRPLFHFFRKIIFPVYAGVLVPQNGLVTQIVAALVRPQDTMAGSSQLVTAPR